jgi:hypothetical protein
VIIPKKPGVLRLLLPQNTRFFFFFCSLPAHGAGKKGEAELDTKVTFEG